MSKIPSKATLITNLDYVTIGEVRTYTHALLIQTIAHPFDERVPVHKLRGFSISASAPTFDIVIPSGEFDLAETSSAAFVTLQESDEGGSKVTPLLHGATLKIPGFALPIQLIAVVNSERGLDVITFEDGTDVNQIWQVLPVKVAEHWTAPYIPVQEHHAVELVRALYERERRAASGAR